MCKYKYTTKFKYKLQAGPPNYLHLHVYALWFVYFKNKYIFESHQMVDISFIWEVYNTLILRH